jgi:toxin ParE1/3/4
MKYKILLTEQADIDLRNTYEYIAYTLLEPQMASEQLDSK